MSTEGDHHGHYKHPKIAKNTSSKLPDAFLQSKGTVIVPKKIQQQKMKQESTQKQKVNKNQLDKQKSQTVQQRPSKQKQSRNPFLPIRKFKQQMQKFAQERKAVEQMLSQHRFEHLRVPQSNLNEREQQKIRYEDFITLTLVSKKQTFSLKKIVHVPKLKVYYLKESLISISIDKTQLHEWMQNCNQQGKKIVEMFWNMPQGYYSLIYEYAEGVLMQTLLDNLNALPLSIIQNIAISHFTHNIGIYNSQLILNVNQENDLPLIYYMPLYEETPPLIRSEKLQSILMQEIQQDDVDRKIIWRLGIILMASFLGEEFLRSDLLQIEIPLKSCCLFHAIIQLKDSLCRLYLEQNNLFEEAQHLISFLCHLLSIKKSPTFTISLSELKLKKHKFLTSKYESLLSLKELFHTISMIDLEDCNYALGEFGSEHKLHKTIDVIGLSLQNINMKKIKNIDFSVSNKNIKCIAQELGLRNDVQKVAKCLHQIYERQGR